MLQTHTQNTWFLRLIHTYHAFPLLCLAAKGLDCVFPIWFTHCGRVWFTHAMPRPCFSESDFSRPRHSAAWAWHGMCELTSAIQRQHVGDLPAFGFFRLPRWVPLRLLSEAYHSVKLLDLQFELSRRTQHYRRMAVSRHSMCELTRHGMAGEQHGRGTAWQGHSMGAARRVN
jgi:hypothetical protein